MAIAQRGRVAPVRKLIAVMLGTFATFVILFGAGMTSWSIVAVGVALLILAVSLAMITTVRSSARAWVNGVGHVHSVSDPPTSSAFGRCELQIVIDAPGMPPRSVRVRDPRVPVAKWPDRGDTLPIMVALDDQRHVRVLWDEVPTRAEAAAAKADLPLEFDDFDDTDDDLLIEQDAPPWAHRTIDDDVPLGPGIEPDRPVRGDPTGHHDEPVVVRQTAHGTLVLEGTLVDSASSAPLPHQVATDLVDDGSEPATTGPTALTATAEPDPAESDDEALLAGIRETDTSAGATAGQGASIHGVGITLLVADLARSVAFYRDVLGFTELDAGTGNAILTSGSTRLVLRAIPDVAPINRRVVHLNLEVADLETAHEQLKNKGVRFIYAPRVVNRAMKLELWAAAFRDPDGHGVALTQWRDRVAA